jgi:hypothetical protein
LNKQYTEILLENLIEIEGENLELAKENHQLLKAIDWKLWEILKIANAFAKTQNLTVTEPFPVDNDDD